MPSPSASCGEVAVGDEGVAQRLLLLLGEGQQGRLADGAGLDAARHGVVAAERGPAGGGLRQHRDRGETLQHRDVGRRLGRGRERQEAQPNARLSLSMAVMGSSSAAPAATRAASGHSAPGVQRAGARRGPSDDEAAPWGGSGIAGSGRAPAITCAWRAPCPSCSCALDEWPWASSACFLAAVWSPLSWCSAAVRCDLAGPSRGARRPRDVRLSACDPPVLCRPKGLHRTRAGCVKFRRVRAGRASGAAVGPVEPQERGADACDPPGLPCAQAYEAHGRAPPRGARAAPPGPVRGGRIRRPKVRGQGRGRRHEAERAELDPELQHHVMRVEADECGAVGRRWAAVRPRSGGDA